MLAKLVRVQGDKVAAGDCDVLQGNRAENAPKTQPESVPKPRQGKEREKVGAENPDPEKYHGAAGFGRDVNDPKDEPDMNELCRSVGEAEFAPVACQPIKTWPQPRYCASSIRRPEQEKGPPRRCP